MSWTKAQQAGFALAATACGDRGAALASPGLAHGVRTQATERARALAAAPREARRAWVTDTIASLRGAELTAPVRTGATPPRALALVAHAAPRSLGDEWLAHAPTPRAGYSPEPTLRTLLLRLVARAARSTDPPPGAA